ncbi:hypothetical protein BKA58DRAFT_371966 [Alternaria rosae]|uniref:uncharacterized protein n=1 Tax=Alternaria rosae TaxID=1187941 RepID=UPI001E8E5EB0|nr:uncharacterized protein BKA58DRAFT_371966 [Alternaria rosae]KAH6881665.1 hypothetical protein BKA58DRAFT_371966 [Alternaria rosae]
MREDLPHLHDDARTPNARSDNHDLSPPAYLFVHQTASGLSTLTLERKGVVLGQGNWNGILIGGIHGRPGRPHCTGRQPYTTFKHSGGGYPQYDSDTLSIGFSADLPLVRSARILIVEGHGISLASKRLFRTIGHQADARGVPMRRFKRDIARIALGGVLQERYMTALAVAIMHDQGDLLPHYPRSRQFGESGSRIASVPSLKSSISVSRYPPAKSFQMRLFLAFFLIFLIVNNGAAAQRLATPEEWWHWACRGGRLVQAMVWPAPHANEFLDPISSPWDGNMAYELAQWGYSVSERPQLCEALKEPKLLKRSADGRSGLVEHVVRVRL